MRNPLALIALVLAAGVAGSAMAADPPDISTLVASAKAALEPPKSSLRQMNLSISGEVTGATSQWTVAQARKTIGGQGRILNVLLAPATNRGIASLVIDGTPPETALYLPAVGRVRTLVPLDGYEAFLNSDFTFFDLGFARRHDKYTHLGAEQRGGRDAWKIEQVPVSPWYYSKIVSWIDKSTMLPIERNYYAPSGQLWKVETFDKVVTIDGQPVPLKVTMKNVQTEGTSVIEVSNLKFGVDLPDSLFERGNLPKATDAPIWAGLK
jgi:hypothetical protein